MAQKSENYKFEGKYAEFIPAASTAIAAGDAVRLLNGTLVVATAVKATYKDFIGFCDDDWSATRAIQLYGATSTDFATPTTRPVKLKVYHEGVMDLAIRETTGTQGQAVYLLTATTGAQVFTIEPNTVAAETVMGPVGFLYETFSGATANDCQKVRITAGLQNNPKDIRWHLMNRLIFWGQINNIAACTGVTNTLLAIAGSAQGDSYAICFGRVIALVNGMLVAIESDCIGGTIQLTDSITYSMVIIYGIGSGGSICIFYDTAKRTTAVASATLRADPVYWPSVSTDYLPIGLAIMKGSECVISGRITVMFPTVADCLRVT